MSIKEKVIGKINIFFILKNWNDYFLDFFGMKKGKKVVYHLRNGLKYKTRGGSTDRNVLNEILVYGDYSPKGFEIKRNDIIVDIGAHIGIFSIYAGSKNPDGKVFSFEPLEENFKILKENIILNNLQNTTPVNFACSNKSERRELFLTKSNNFGETSFFGKNRENKVTINTINFKDFLREKNIKKVDLLKIDCEGAEYEILFNLTSKDLTKIEKIVMEVHNVNNEKNIWHLGSFLLKNNFVLKVNGSPNSQTSMLYAKKRH